MQQYIAMSLTFLGYIVIISATIVGQKYGVVDNQTSALIIGGVLSHLGFNTAPNILPIGGKNVTSSDNQGQK